MRASYACISIQEIKLKKQDVTGTYTAHLRAELHLHAGDSNATYKLHFEDKHSMAPYVYFHERIRRAPTEGELRARSDLHAQLQRCQPRAVPFNFERAAPVAG